MFEKNLCKNNQSFLYNQKSHLLIICLKDINNFNIIQNIFFYSK